MSKTTKIVFDHLKNAMHPLDAVIEGSPLGYINCNLIINNMLSIIKINLDII